MNEIALRLAAKQENQMPSGLKPALTGILSAGIVLPPLYVIAVVQYAAVLYPWWDELALLQVIASSYDGVLHFTDLFSWHSQSRPLIPRIIFILNAIATDWDIRSEYTFIYITIFGLFVVHLYVIRRLSVGLLSFPFLVLAAAVSILICSPVGHHTQWYSLMLMPTLSNLCAAASLFIISFRKDSWLANIVAACLGWLSAYSVSFGLFLFPVIFVVHQIASGRPLLPSKLGIFWLINTGLLYGLYLPGIPPGDMHPSLLEFAEFILIYLGNPLASLMWYPVGFQTHPWLANVKGAGLLGFVLLTASALLALKASVELRTKRPEAFIFMSFSGCGVLSAIVTAWGRASGVDGISVATQSRYSIFAVYLTFGLLYYVATWIARERSLLSPVPSYLLAGVVLTFLLASAVTYVRALPDYRDAHNMNEWLSKAYASRTKPTSLDRNVFPFADMFQDIKTTLLRLGIGPYRGTANIMDLASSDFVGTIPLTAGRKVTERFRINNMTAQSILLSLVTYAKSPTSYNVTWKVVAFGQNLQVEIGHGGIWADTITDWQSLKLPLSTLNFAANELEIEFYVAPDQDSSIPIGLPLFRPANEISSEPVRVDEPTPAGAVLGLSLRYFN
jgi:hypothetical protein